MTISPAVLAHYRPFAAQFVAVLAVKEAATDAGMPAEQAGRLARQLVAERVALAERRVTCEAGPDATMYGGRLADGEALGMVTGRQ